MVVAVHHKALKEAEVFLGIISTLIQFLPNAALGPHEEWAEQLCHEPACASAQVGKALTTLLFTLSRRTGSTKVIKLIVSLLISCRISAFRKSY